jgi:hypothetical protein
VAELHVPDDVVDRHQQHVVGVRLGFVARDVAGQERALVALALDEQVQRVAVGGDGRQLDAPVLVLDPVGRVHATRAMRDRVLVSRSGVRDAQGDLVDAVPVKRVVAGDLVATHQGPRQHQADPALLQHVRDAIATTGLEPRVGGLGEAVRAGEEIRRLRRVADVELDVIDAVDRHAVVGGSVRNGSRRCRHHYMITV